jgi:formate-nitrite transporter family protein
MTSKNESAANRSRTDLSDPVLPRDHTRGSASAKVTLVEYGDFGCPFCAAAVPVLRELERRFGPDLRLVFRHNPRGFDHPHAPKAAEAAEAAAEQGKFWEMHDLLFAHQDALEDDDLIGYARGLGLDVAKFTANLRSGAHRDRVHADELSGVRSRVISTPSFFINGKHFSDTPDVERLGQAIEAARQASAG